MIKWFLPVLILSANLYAQEPKKDILAVAGGKEISVSEFQARFELNPQVQIHRKLQGEANKKIFLYGLVAEKLLALDAAGHRLDTSEVVQFYLKNFEKIFVRDALYKKEIKEKSKKYAEELLSFYLVNASRIFTKTIISKDEQRINTIYSLLKKGVPFDSLYSELLPSERDTITLFAGTLDDNTEKALFTLPEKSFSSPLNYNEHRVIFYVEMKSSPVLAKSMGWEAEFKRLEKASQEKAEAVFYKEYMKNFFPGRKADANGFLIKSLAEKLNSLLIKGTDQKFTASSSDFVKISRSYSPDTLDQVFVRFEKDTVLFKDFINWMRTETFEIKENSFQEAASLLNAKVKKFIGFELLAAEGYRQGLDKTDDVQSSFIMWKDNYLYQMRLSELNDSLFSKSGLDYYYKVIEIVNNDLDIIKHAMDEISSGSDFSSAAYKYSYEKPDTSYRPFSSLGEIRDHVTQVNNNEVYGPIRSSRGYILFKVIDKKISGELSGTNTLPLTNPFDKYISGLAEKYKLTVNEALLSGIKNSNINALVFRYIGFGGKLSAVPVIVPISDWYNEWQKTSPINP